MAESAESPEGEVPRDKSDASGTAPKASGTALPNGAVAVIDALGFKGIWKRVRDPQLVLDTLTAAKERAIDDEREVLGPYVRDDGGSFQINFFSDSVIVTCSGTLPPAKALMVVASAVS